MAPCLGLTSLHAQITLELVYALLSTPQEQQQQCMLKQRMAALQQRPGPDWHEGRGTAEVLLCDDGVCCHNIECALNACLFRCTDVCMYVCVFVRWQPVLRLDVKRSCCWGRRLSQGNHSGQACD
jgi:hypothetical protein